MQSLWVKLDALLNDQHFNFDTEQFDVIDNLNTLTSDKVKVSQLKLFILDMLKDENDLAS